MVALRVRTDGSEAPGIIILYTALYHAASDTLSELAADCKYLGTDIGYICILHTWGSTMNFHPHIHAIVLGGGLDVKNHWNANYVQTECQFRYCGTAIPFLTVRSTAR